MAFCENAFLLFDGKILAREKKYAKLGFFVPN